MEDDTYFSTLITKGFSHMTGDDRYFEGFLTVQMKDKQGEITIVDELYKVLPIWMDRGAPISDTHSNRIIGKGINYSKTIYKDGNGEDIPAIKITGKIFKNYELDTDIWEKIKSGEYKGLSFGGATRSNRTPMKMKDGSIAYALSDLEHYEVAVCKDPAVPLALITQFNPVAKAMAGYSEERSDGTMLIKCSKFGCYVEKTHQRNAVEDEIIGEMDDGDKKIPRSRVANVDDISDLGDDLDDKFSTDDDGRIGESATISVLNAKKLKAGFERGCPNGECNYKQIGRDQKTPPHKFCPECGEKMDGGIGDVKVSHDDRTLKAEKKEKEVELTEDGKEVFDEAKRYAELNMYKADLGKYRTFEEKVAALVREGKSRKSAENIVGSFVKDEKKAVDFSNADGDSNTNMSNQNVGRESWQGNGTPYPKKVDEGEEDEEKKIGMKVETAFTEDKKEAENSVENHLKKDPKHYSKLKDVFDGIEKADEDKPLNKPMRDDGDKKFKVYVKDPNTGKIVIVRFGDPNMEIKRDDPERRASFRARHDCDNAKDITTPKYWSCKMWEKETSVTDQIEKMETTLNQINTGIRHASKEHEQGSGESAQVTIVQPSPIVIIKPVKSKTKSIKLQANILKNKLKSI